MICKNCNREMGINTVCPYCNTNSVCETLPHHLPKGCVIGGRYTILGVLGEGGFGITYLGCDNKLDFIVAIKEYFPHGYSYRNSATGRTVSVSSANTKDIFERGKQRFLNEAKTIARFKNLEGIVNVINFIEDNNTAYIVMEYIEGVNLLEYLKQNGTMSAGKAIELLTGVMKSLEKIHSEGVIHRDISPDNIMYLNNGKTKLMDFGSAKDFSSGSNSTSVMLKPGYAPYEQYQRNGHMGSWTDVYGLCATIYRCITGKAPDDALDRIVEDHLKKPSELGADISGAQESALMYGLAVHEQDRCQSVSELLDLFDNAAPDMKPAGELIKKTNTNEEEQYTVLADEKYDDSKISARKEVYDNTMSETAHVAENIPIKQAPAGQRIARQESVEKTRRSPLPIILGITGVIIAVLIITLVILKLPSEPSDNNAVNSVVSDSLATVPSSYGITLVDSANVLTDNEEDLLEATITDLRNDHNCNICFAAVNDLSNAPFSFNGTAIDYAECYYEKEYGVNSDGVIVFLVMNDENGDRQIIVLGTGKCQELLTNAESEEIRQNAVTNHNPGTNGYYDFLNSIAKGLAEAL